MTATWSSTDRSRAALPTRLPQPPAHLLPLWEAAPTLPPAWLGALPPRQALCLLAVERWGADYGFLAQALGCRVADVAAAVFAARDALRLVSVPPCGLAAQGRRQRAGRGPTAAPDTLLGGLLSPAVWFLALAGIVGASVLVMVLVAVAPAIEALVGLAEVGAGVAGELP